MSPSQVHLGSNRLHEPQGQVGGETVSLLGEPFYCIRHYDRMPPFFMSIVSSADHWMFLSSTGGLSAGRINAESALFPYETDDKIAEGADHTGPLAIILANRNGRTLLWEPFSRHSPGVYRIERNLYKNAIGDKIVFEEINHDLGLAYRYAWRSSDRFGFVHRAWLRNDNPDRTPLSLLAGVQNLLPYGVTTAVQTGMSNLLNAYKRAELDPQTGLGLFTLSSILTDLAEPSEALGATTTWQVGLENPRYLLSPLQVEAFRRGAAVTPEHDVRGRRGAYLVHADLDLPGGAEHTWSIVLEVNQDHSRVAFLRNLLTRECASGLAARIEEDVAGCSADLAAIVAAADGLQLSGDALSATHHFANVLFNTMRGGIFAENYLVRRDDLADFLRMRSRPVFEQRQAFLNGLPDPIGVDELLERAAAAGSPDLERLCYEYLPLTFSRRHGDPSRPWNRFSINIRKPDGSRKLDYQGNWRDIFQNWEPLALSYPEFVESMIARFLNATTADGYNPYRVTRDGIEWETPSPDAPWANIGYWSDHQIIYLEKLLELSERFHPGRLRSLLDRRIFSYANVPYRIKAYSDLLGDWYHTIAFDHDLDKRIQAVVSGRGTDGRLLADADGNVIHAGMAEKLLVLLLAKLVNLVPEGGIWMNTQRPEWNDANNALAGKGLSVVTLGYLRRFIAFCHGLLEGGPRSLAVAAEVGALLEAVEAVLDKHAPALAGPFGDEERRAVMDELGQAGSDYRWGLYRTGFSGRSAALEREALLTFLDLAQRYVEHSLRANRRPDGMYHAYNTLRLGEGRASIGRLYEMLEGQVAILSSGLLSADESLALLKSLRASRMYRADQHSYTLYPDRDLPGFLQKNQLRADQVEGSRLIQALVAAHDPSLVTCDEDGVYHFQAGLRSARLVRQVLERLGQQPAYRALVEAEGGMILELYEKTFDHDSFTGRSGSFFAYEGLGSIYWHMVAKLLLAAQETYLGALEQNAAPATVQALAECYYDIRQGIGFNKTPEVYGAFPTDPYSHTPAGQGARQPGMTGQVKEEILTRLAELGLFVEAGQITFRPVLLRAGEFLPEATVFEYVDVSGKRQSVDLPAGALAYTFCQVPVVLERGSETRIEVRLSDGEKREIEGDALDAETSRHIFRRDGRVREVGVQVRLAG